ncbi:MAG: hypothetical protein WCT16_05230 [Candidatus Buchananbacteria bacterium]
MSKGSLKTYRAEDTSDEKALKSLVNESLSTFYKDQLKSLDSLSRESANTVKSIMDVIHTVSLFSVSLEGLSKGLTDTWEAAEIASANFKFFGALKAPITGAGKGVLAPQVDLGKFSNEDLSPLERLAKTFPDISNVLQQEQERVKAIGSFSKIFDDFAKAQNALQDRANKLNDVTARGDVLRLQDAGTNILNRMKDAMGGLNSSMGEVLTTISHLEKLEEVKKSLESVAKEALKFTQTMFSTVSLDMALGKHPLAPTPAPYGQPRDLNKFEREQWMIDQKKKIGGSSQEMAGLRIQEKKLEYDKEESLIAYKQNIENSKLSSETENAKKALSILWDAQYKGVEGLQPMMDTLKYELENAGKTRRVGISGEKQYYGVSSLYGMDKDIARVQEQIKEQDYSKMREVVTSPLEALQKTANGYLETVAKSMEPSVKDRKDSLGVAGAELENIKTLTATTVEGLSNIGKVAEEGLAGLQTSAMGASTAMKAVEDSAARAAAAMNNIPTSIAPPPALGSNQSYSTDVKEVARASGGTINGPPGNDVIPARLSRGEYVIPRGIVNKFGVSFFDDLRKGRAPGFALGGLVDFASSGAMDLEEEKKKWLEQLARQERLSADAVKGVLPVDASEKYRNDLISAVTRQQTGLSTAVDMDQNKINSFYSDVDAATKKTTNAPTEVRMGVLGLTRSDPSSKATIQDVLGNKFADRKGTGYIRGPKGEVIALGDADELTGGGVTAKMRLEKLRSAVRNKSNSIDNLQQLAYGISGSSLKSLEDQEFLTKLKNGVTPDVQDSMKYVRLINLQEDKRRRDELFAGANEDLSGGADTDKLRLDMLASAAARMVGGMGNVGGGALFGTDSKFGRFGVNVQEGWKSTREKGLKETFMKSVEAPMEFVRRMSGDMSSKEEEKYDKSSTVIKGANFLAEGLLGGAHRIGSMFSNTMSKKEKEAYDARLGTGLIRAPGEIKKAWNNYDFWESSGKHIGETAGKVSRGDVGAAAGAGLSLVGGIGTLGAIGKGVKAAFVGLKSMSETEAILERLSKKRSGVSSFKPGKAAAPEEYKKWFLDKYFGTGTPTASAPKVSTPTTSKIPGTVKDVSSPYITPEYEKAIQLFSETTENNKIRAGVVANVEKSRKAEGYQFLIDKFDKEQQIKKADQQRRVYDRSASGEFHYGEGYEIKRGPEGEVIDMLDVVKYPKQPYRTHGPKVEVSPYYKRDLREEALWQKKMVESERRSKGKSASGELSGYGPNTKPYGEPRMDYLGSKVEVSSGYKSELEAARMLRDRKDVPYTSVSDKIKGIQEGVVGPLRPGFNATTGDVLKLKDITGGDLSYLSKNQKSPYPGYQVYQKGRHGGKEAALDASASTLREYKGLERSAAGTIEGLKSKGPRYAKFAEPSVQVGGGLPTDLALAARRDMSPAGVLRRQQFDELMTLSGSREDVLRLIKAGYGPDEIKTVIKNANWAEKRMLQKQRKHVDRKTEAEQEIAAIRSQAAKEAAEKSQERAAREVYARIYEEAGIPKDIITKNFDRLGTRGFGLDDLRTINPASWGPSAFGNRLAIGANKSIPGSTSGFGKRLLSGASTFVGKMDSVLGKIYNPGRLQFMGGVGDLFQYGYDRISSGVGKFFDRRRDKKSILSEATRVGYSVNDAKAFTRFYDKGKSVDEVKALIARSKQLGTTEGKSYYSIGGPQSMITDAATRGMDVNSGSIKELLESGKPFSMREILGGNASEKMSGKNISLKEVMTEDIDLLKASKEKKLALIDYFSSADREVTPQSMAMFGLGAQTEMLSDQVKRMNPSHRLEDIYEGMKTIHLDSDAARFMKVRATDLNKRIDNRAQLTGSRSKAIETLYDEEYEKLKNFVNVSQRGFTVPGSASNKPRQAGGSPSPAVRAPIVPSLIDKVEDLGLEINRSPKDVLKAFRKLKVAYGDKSTNQILSFIRKNEEGNRSLSYKMYARGGFISGPGTKTSDSIPALLSKGEYVIPANIVDRLGVNTFDSLINGKASKFALGGLVGESSSSSAPAQIDFSGLVDAVASAIKNNPINISQESITAIQGALTTGAESLRAALESVMSQGNQQAAPTSQGAAVRPAVIEEIEGRITVLNEKISVNQDVAMTELNSRFSDFEVNIKSELNGRIEPRFVQIQQDLGRLWNAVSNASSLAHASMSNSFTD